MDDVKLDFQAWLAARRDSELSDESDALGDELLAWMDEQVVVEKSGWAPELCERVATRLQAADPASIRKRPVVFWSEQRTAFAVPGRYIYVGRRLIEEAMPEDAVAFLFAHELAHHRLGHTKQLVPALRWAKHLPVAQVASFLAVAAVRLATSREQEIDADAWAFERCLEVGYDGRACLRLFDVLRKVAEDYGDLDMAHGPDDVEAAAQRELDKHRQPEWRTALSALLDRGARARWEMGRGYPSIRDRRARLEARLAERA
ncbi:M48 family metalloprotease [Pendulispora rubella]|uniref:M48 family metalloprotease n=1 Tax=Pendulispora rubella TaxID=2741070 RepID=A0ABZ2L5U3_9BACT